MGVGQEVLLSHFEVDKQGLNALKVEGQVSGHGRDTLEGLFMCLIPKRGTSSCGTVQVVARIAHTHRGLGRLPTAGGGRGPGRTTFASHSARSLAINLTSSFSRAPNAACKRVCGGGGPPIGRSTDMSALHCPVPQAHTVAVGTFSQSGVVSVPASSVYNV